MRIRYIKPGGDGVEADLPDGAARRLIRSRAAEAVETEGPTDNDAWASQPAAPARAAAKKKTAARSR